MPPAPRATPGKGAPLAQKILRLTFKRLLLWVGGACVPPACGCGCLFVLIVVVAILTVASITGILEGLAEVGEVLIDGVQAVGDEVVDAARDIGNFFRRIFP